MSAHSEIEEAYARLEAHQGFSRREAQVQLSLILSDLIDASKSGMIEAPTGLGKSIALLLAALIQSQRRQGKVVIATYTNMLAEQYWFKDLQIALELLPDFDRTRVQFLIGRQRYVCRAALIESVPAHAEVFDDSCELGTDNEWRRYAQSQGKKPLPQWSQISVPPVCPARACPHYDSCYYYAARRRAEDASVVITNHSVVIQHMLMRQSSESNDGLLGKVDFIILDEGHDFLQAAQNGLEYEISLGALQTLQAVATRLEKMLEIVAKRMGDEERYHAINATFKKKLESFERSLTMLATASDSSGVIRIAPSDLGDHPAVKRIAAPDQGVAVNAFVAEFMAALGELLTETRLYTMRWNEIAPEAVRPVMETVRSYMGYLDTFALGASHMIEPEGASITFMGSDVTRPRLRMDTLDLSEPLERLLWSETPTALVSATLAIDARFEFFHRALGLKPDIEEVLPSPFDFASQAALYMPPMGRIPDPSSARDPDLQKTYFFAVAQELTRLLRAVGGRTLALFHSRKEMEGVAAFMPRDLPFRIYVQPPSASGHQGERFRKDETSCLFGLRTFWTGFDAPGPTLSHVALVRIPFEVPIEPTSIARAVHLQSQGLDPFAEWTLANAKLLIRQGFGRLIRRTDDRGIVSILDPRVRTKPYGEAIIENLPTNVRQFDDFVEAMAWVGLDFETE